jgi:hypothetical protein
MNKPVRPEDAILQELFADLGPEELEPRLELQLFLDPMTSLSTANQQQQQQQQQQKVPVDTVSDL